MLQFWENLDGIANLVSLIEVEKKGWTVTYCTESIWEVTSPYGQVTLRFLTKKARICKGMPYIDLTNPDSHVIYNGRNTTNKMAMIELICKNYEGFMRGQITRAAEMRDTLAMMAHPMENNSKNMW